MAQRKIGVSTVTFLAAIFLCLCNSAVIYGQNDYYVRKAAEYTGEAEYYQKMAEGYKREAAYYLKLATRLMGL